MLRFGETSLQRRLRPLLELGHAVHGLAVVPEELVEGVAGKAVEVLPAAGEGVCELRPQFQASIIEKRHDEDRQGRRRRAPHTEVDSGRDGFEERADVHERREELHRVVRVLRVEIGPHCTDPA